MYYHLGGQTYFWSNVEYIKSKYHLILSSQRFLFTMQDLVKYVPYTLFLFKYLVKFYLVLLFCDMVDIQGTTRPTHYHVLLDEVGFTADDLQELVHSLSYV